MNRWRAVVMAAVLTAAAACSSDGESTPSSSASAPLTPSATATLTPSPTPTESASVTAAKAAYLAFIERSYAVERKPKNADLSDVAEVSVDPAFASVQKSVLSLAYDGLAYRGTPPTSRLRLLSDVRPGEQRPTVKLIDCPTVAPSWLPASIATGKPAAVIKPKVPPPFALTATVSRLAGHWVVSSTSTDRGRTCVPQR